MISLVINRIKYDWVSDEIPEHSSSSVSDLFYWARSHKPDLQHLADCLTEIQDPRCLMP